MMRIVKNILIGFGVLFVAVIWLVLFIGAGSSEFREKQSPFIEGFMMEFSENWDVADVHSKLDNDLLKQIDSPSGRAALGVFRALGDFEAMHDLVLQHYTTATSGKTGRFTFKALFENGPALVEIMLVESEGKTLVIGLHITPAGDAPVAHLKHEA